MLRIKYNVLLDDLKGYCLACLLCYSIPTIGQSLYISTDHNEIYRIENDFSLTYITTAIYSKTLTDIAFSTTGQLYGIASRDIVKIDLESGEVNLLFQLLAYDFSNSLACSSDDKLYLRGMSSNVLYAYSLPDSSMQLINHFASDQNFDLTFYKGNILWGSGYKYEIEVYDPRKKTISKIACQIRNLPISGISTVMDSCGSEHVYVIDSYGSLFEINFENHLLERIYNFSGPNRLILGMASISEYLGTYCYSHLEPVECEDIVGIEEQSSNDIVNIYPNPATDFITIQCEIPIEGVKIYNLSGALVKFIHQSTQTIDIHDLPSGIYFLQLTSGQKSFYQKIVIQ